MLGRFDHPHLRALFQADREPVTRGAVVIGIIGVAVPVVVGFLAGVPALGLGIGLGAMLLGGGSRVTQDVRESIVLAVAAVGLALVIAGTRWGDAALIAIAATAALLGGYSRALAISSVRFCIYLVLCVSILETASDRRAAAAAFALGAGWNMLLRRLIGGAPVREPPSPYSRARRIAAFRRRLRGWSAWQYCIRLGAGLAVASVVRHLWAGHHGGWLLITVVLLTGRVFERFPVKVTQRALGVTLGVLLTWGLMAVTQTVLVTVAVVSVLAAAMTPLILLVLDFGRPRHPGLLLERLIATLVGSAIVLIVNVAMDGVLAREARRVALAA